MGTRKLQNILKKDHKLSIGRDRLFTILRENGLLIKRKQKNNYIPLKNRPNIKNLASDMEITRPGQVLAVDITYLKTKKRHYYLSVLIDSYSRKIVNYNLAQNLSYINSLNVLLDTIKKHKYLIHHSDGGCQYTCEDYQNLLKEHKIEQSMTRPSSPQENPIVERAHGILKHEYGLAKAFNNFDELKEKTESAIHIYNELRPHSSLGFKTPSAVHSEMSRA